MTKLVATLVACGALPKKNRGPQNPRSPEEAKLVKREQDARSKVRRKALIDEAKAQGLPPPVFHRGRPSKYTEEEAKEAKQAQLQAGYRLYRDRLKRGVETLKRMSESPAQQGA